MFYTAPNNNEHTLIYYSILFYIDAKTFYGRNAHSIRFKKELKKTLPFKTIQTCYYNRVILKMILKAKF